MGAERYVVLGLARARSGWFAAVAQWANAGTIPAEFVKCVSREEVRARLASGRPFSALLVDGSLPVVDRDLVDAASAAGCPTIVVDDGRGGREWAAVGAAAVLRDFFDPKSLLDTLVAHADPIGRGDAVPGEPAPPTATAWRGRVAAVCGPGGTGASTVAVALAQGLADDPRLGHAVLLADLALQADQAMLHDARDVVPGVQELVEEHRTRRLSPEEVRSLTFDVPERGYHLLLGLRRARFWASLRPRAFAAAFESLRGAYRVVVCDTDADVEGEDEGGSLEVEERHVMSRTAVLGADVVLAVGLPGLKGAHALARVLTDLRAAGAPPGRVVPVVNRAPRGGRARAELAATLAGLTGADAAPFAPVVFLPERRVEEPLTAGARLHPGLTRPLAGAFAAVVDGAAPPAGADDARLRPVRPGSLGSWSGGDAEEAALG
ncbi:MAG: CpaE family protein [Acidimicrobiia bacterium]